MKTKEHLAQLDHNRYMRRRVEKLAQDKKWRKTTKIGQAQTCVDHSRRRAKAKGLPHDITGKYIASITPDVCPVLGIPLVRNTFGAAPNSPSLDRIVPELGYVKGNVIVVSMLANTIRSNATPQQIRRVADFYEELLTYHMK